VYLLEFLDKLFHALPVKAADSMEVELGGMPLLFESFSNRVEHGRDF